VDLKEEGCEGVGCIDMTQDRDMWQACEQGNKPSGSLKKRNLLGFSVTINQGSAPWN
jgi:hypothetical protein